MPMPTPRSTAAPIKISRVWPGLRGEVAIVLLPSWCVVEDIGAGWGRLTTTHHSCPSGINVFERCPGMPGHVAIHGRSCLVGELTKFSHKLIPEI
jgi:hypothetical protein